MALIRNIAGLGAMDLETLKCAEPGCTAVGEGGTVPYLDDSGPYLYQQVPGSGVAPQVIENPIDPIQRTTSPGGGTVTTDVPPPANVVTVGPVTPEPTQKKVDTVGLALLAAMGVILMQKESKGFVRPGLYLGAAAALYYHLKSANNGS